MDLLLTISRLDCGLRSDIVVDRSWAFKKRVHLQVSKTQQPSQILSIIDSKSLARRDLSFDLSRDSPQVATQECLKETYRLSAKSYHEDGNTYLTE